MSMLRPRFLATAILFAAITLPAHAQDYLRSNPQFVQAFRDAVQTHASSIVRVQCNGRDVCLGTIVAADGWVLTKAHDLTGKITCKLEGGRAYEAKLVRSEERHDLALLKIAAEKLHAISFSNSKHRSEEHTSE